MDREKKDKMAGNEKRGCSVWLIPSDKNIYTPLSNMIRTISSTHTNPILGKHIPIFEPHVTLSDDINQSVTDTISKTERLAGLIRPFEVNIGYILTGKNTDYFKSVYCDVKRSAGIIMANEKAVQIFGRNGDAPYLPHMSLTYGQFSDNERHEIVTKLINMNNGKTLFSGYSFIADRLALYLTKGPVTSWQKITDFKMSGKD
jgi:hypothetical protein